MLIWKIFVIILSVTSLTLVNVNSSSDPPPSGTPRPPRNLFVNARFSNVPSHSGTPEINTKNLANVGTSSDVPSLPSRQRPPRDGYANVNPSDALNTSRRSRRHDSSSANLNSPDNPSTSTPCQSRTPTPRQILGTIYLYNQETLTTYPVIYNTYNPFDNETFGHKCYKQISVFCDTAKNELESNDCIVRAIFYFKNNLLVKNPDDSYEFLLRVVRTFFNIFPLNTDDMPLPITFCNKKATEAMAAVTMERGPDYQVSHEEQEAKDKQLKRYVKSCIRILGEYHAFIPELSTMEEDKRISAVIKARDKIAHHALNNKTTLGMQAPGETTLRYEGLYEDKHIWYQEPENLELSYLHEISKTITSGYAEHKPSLYCQKMEENFNNHYYNTRNLTQNVLN